MSEETKFRVFIENLELGQRRYCLEFGDKRIANLEKQQYEVMKDLLHFQAENERLKDVLREVWYANIKQIRTDGKCRNLNCVMCIALRKVEQALKEP